MRSILCILSLFALAAAVEPVPIALPNGSFEQDAWDGDRGLPTGWTPAPMNEFAICALDPTTRHGGGSSLHLKDAHTGQANEGLSYALPPKQVEAVLGKTLRLRGWVRQKFSKTGGNVFLGIMVKTRDQRWILQKAGPDGEGESPWGEYAVRHAIPRNAELVRIVLACAQGWGNMAEAWFDDLSMAYEETEAPVARAKSGSRVDVYDDSFPSQWRKASWGGLTVEETEIDPLEGSKRLRVRAAAGTKAYSGWRIFTEAINRMASFTAYRENGGYLEFAVRPMPPIQVAWIAEKGAAPPVPIRDYASPLERGWTRVRIPLQKLMRPEGGERLAGLMFQCSAAPEGEETSFDSMAIACDRENLAAPTALPEGIRAALEAIEGPAVPFTRDDFERPEIREGTFYWKGRPHFFAGPWHYDNDTDFKGPATHREGYGAAGYGETVLDAAQAKTLGFTSLQLSSAPNTPLILGLDGPIIPRDIERTQFYPGFLKGLSGMPFVLDYAWIWGLEKLDLVGEGRLPADILQQNRGWHAFIPFCPEHPKGREIYRRYFQSGVRSARANGGNPFVYELFNESSYQCRCRYNRAAFAVRLRARWGSIAAANEAWKSRFADFDQAAATEPLEKCPGLFVDWLQFTGDRYVEVLEEGKKAIRELDGRPRVYFTEQASIPNYLSASGASMDYRKIAAALDLVCVEGGVPFGSSRQTKALSDFEAVIDNQGIQYSLYLDMATALAKGKPVVNHELYCGRFEDGLRVPSRRSDLLTSLWNEMIHGSSASYFYVWDKRSFDWKTPEEAKQNVLQGGYKAFSLLNPYAYPAQAHLGIRDFHDEMERLGALVLPGKRIRGRVGFLISYASLRQAAITQAPTLRLARELYQTILESHLPLEVVYEEDFTAKAPFEAVVAPFLDHRLEQTPARLTGFAEAGGLVVVSAGALGFDEYGRPEDASGLLGVRRGESRLTATWGSGDPVQSLKETYDATPLTAKVLLESREGRGLLFENSVGKGRVRYLAAAPAGTWGRAAMDRALAGTTRMGELLQTNGTRLAQSEIQSIDRGDTRLFYAVAWGPEPQRARMRLFQTPGDPFYIVDWVAGEAYPSPSGKLAWTKSEASNGIELILPSQTRAVILAQREEPKGLPWVRPAALDARFEKARREEAAWKAGSKSDLEDRDRKAAEARRYEGVREAKCFAIDLSRQANMGFRDEVEGDKKGGWFDQGANDLRAMAPGRRTFSGVPFQILDPGEHDGKAVLVLGGKPRAYLPERATGIPVGRPASRFYFLHTAGWDDGGAVLSYIIRYEGGSFLEVPVRFGVEIGGWWGPKELPSAKIAFECANAVCPRVGLYCFRWENPKPGLKVASIDVVSAMGGAVPAVVAITGEE
ncbi:MAG: beta-galactosidase [Spirochaetes bacterium]|nr:beta-galactosidase [Spirochaetota bacterium]